MKLSEVLTEFLQKNEGLLKYNTLQSYKYSWQKLIKAIGDKLIFEVNQNHIEDFRIWLFKRPDKPHLAQKPTPKSVDTSMRNASPVMQFAVTKGYRKGNPFQGVRKPVIPEKEIIVYSDAELHAMLRCANQLWQTKIVAAASAGLRLGEILNLTWRDVNFEEGYITVQAKESTRDTWPWSPKNSKSRQVPLSKQLEKLFIQRLEMLPEGQPYINLTEKRYTDLQTMRTPPFELSPRLCNTPDSSMRRWDTILRKARIWKGNFKALRSTAITNWLLGGRPPQEVQRLAGHSDISITMRYYAALRQDYVQRAKLEVGVPSSALGTSRPPDERSTKLSYTPKHS